MAHLHLDVVEVAGGIAGEQVQGDGLAVQLGGIDVRIQDPLDLDRRLVVAHGVDQVGQQVRGAGEQELEDQVVAQIEQRAGVGLAGVGPLKTRGVLEGAVGRRVGFGCAAQDWPDRMPRIGKGAVETLHGGLASTREGPP
nr:hypothetical protein [Pigmentiphaga humi]